MCRRNKSTRAKKPNINKLPAWLTLSIRQLLENGPALDVSSEQGSGDWSKFVAALLLEDKRPAWRRCIQSWAAARAHGAHRHAETEKKMQTAAVRIIVHEAVCAARENDDPEKVQKHRNTVSNRQLLVDGKLRVVHAVMLAMLAYDVNCIACATRDGNLRETVKEALKTVHDSAKQFTRLPPTTGAQRTARIADIAELHKVLKECINLLTKLRERVLFPPWHLHVTAGIPQESRVLSNATRLFLAALPKLNTPGINANHAVALQQWFSVLCTHQHFWRWRELGRAFIRVRTADYYSQVRAVIHSILNFVFDGNGDDELIRRLVALHSIPGNDNTLTFRNLFDRHVRDNASVVDAILIGRYKHYIRAQRAYPLLHYSIANLPHSHSHKRLANQLHEEEEDQATCFLQAKKRTRIQPTYEARRKGAIVSASVAADRAKSFICLDVWEWKVTTTTTN